MSAIYPAWLRNALAGRVLHRRARLAASPSDRRNGLIAARSAGFPVSGGELLAAEKAAAETCEWYGQTLPAEPHGFDHLLEACRLGDAASMHVVARLVGSERLTMPLGDVVDMTLANSAPQDQTHFDVLRLYAEELERGVVVVRNDDVALTRWNQHAALLAAHDYDPSVALKLGNLAFDDAGFDLRTPQDAWALARVWWKRAAGSPNEFGARITLEEFPSEMNQVRAGALERLGHLCFYGLGVRKEPDVAFAMWRRAAPHALQAVHAMREALNDHRKSPIFDPAPPEADDENWIKAYPIAEQSEYAKWERHRRAPPQTSAERLVAFRDMTATNGRLGHAVLTLLIGGDDEAARTALMTAHGEGGNVPAPMRRYLFDDGALSALRQAGSRFDPTGEADWAQTTSAIPQQFIEQVQRESVGAELETLMWCDTRLYLAEVAHEPSAPYWRELGQRLQARSPALFQLLHGRAPRSQRELRLMGENIERATVDIGPVLNEKDVHGFPLPGTRARSKARRLFGGSRGWDRVDGIEIDNDGWRIRGELTPDGLEPIVSKDDIETILAVALIELPSRRVSPSTPRDLDFSLSIEPLEGDHTSPVRWLLSRREFAAARWLITTSFGANEYYIDSMLFQPRSGASLFSLDDPYLTRAVQGDGWYCPEPWRRAGASGGVSGWGGSRNAVVISPMAYSDRRPKLELPIHIDMPVALLSFEGSELVKDPSGEEIHRNGGEEMLHFHSVRHARVLSESMPVIVHQFPAYERALQLKRILFGVRHAIEDDVAFLAHGVLYERLRRKRENAIAFIKKKRYDVEVVLSH